MYAIENAHPDDYPALRTLLAASDLPVDGLAPEQLTAFVARRGDGSVAGCAALEPYPDGVLLRSVAVTPAEQGQGLGRRLVAHALGQARRNGVQAIYLLTTTAAPFFAGLGFRTIARDAVAPGVRQSDEFTALCPASATVMLLTMPADEPVS